MMGELIIYLTGATCGVMVAFLVTAFFQRYPPKSDD